MRSRSGTVRRIEATHALDKLERFTGPRVPLRLRRARIGVAAAFAVHAAVAGSFSARLPALKHGLGIGNGRVGLALFVMAVATLVGTRAAPLAVRRWAAETWFAPGRCSSASHSSGPRSPRRTHGSARAWRCSVGSAACSTSASTCRGSPSSERTAGRSWPVSTASGASRCSRAARWGRGGRVGMSLPGNSASSRPCSRSRARRCSRGSYPRRTSRRFQPRCLTCR